jgi:hypothetical protein
MAVRKTNFTTRDARKNLAILPRRRKHNGMQDKPKQERLVNAKARQDKLRQDKTRQDFFKNWNKHFALQHPLLLEGKAKNFSIRHSMNETRRHRRNEKYSNQRRCDS